MRISRRIGRFALDRALLGLLLLAAAGLVARLWLHEHPQHNPWAPLELDHPIGWATQEKLAGLRSDQGECSAVLERGEVEFTRLDATGEGACRREDRLILEQEALSPSGAQMTCPVATGIELWLRKGLDQAARETLGSPIARIEHLGTYSCRRMNGANTGRWSEHATGNAVDIAAFRLEDGRRISLLQDWEGAGAEAQFLRRARESACNVFATVLSPEYNAAHRDHFHLDQAVRPFGSACR